MPIQLRPIPPIPTPIAGLYPHQEASLVGTAVSGRAGMEVPSAGYDPVAQVLSRLKERGEVSKTDRGWEAHCPAHEDAHPSLGVNRGDDGRALLFCQAGCSFRDVTAALGMRVGELFVRGASGQRRASVARTPEAPKRLAAPKPKPALGNIVARYEYVDEAGRHLFEVLRFEPKEFRQRRRDPLGKNGWSWKVAGVRQVLYRLPMVIEAVKAGVTVWIVEGEKDVGNLEAIGLVATCNAGGASKNSLAPKWKPAHAQSLAGAKRVVVIADKDTAGRAHAIAVASSLFGAVSELKVLELPGDRVKDASYWLAQGGAREHLEHLADDAPGWTPPPEGSSPPAGGDGGGLPVLRRGNRQLRDLVRECWEVMHGANEPPSVFWRSGILSRLSVGEGAVHIEEMSTTRTYGQLARLATWIEPGPSG